LNATMMVSRENAAKRRGGSIEGKAKGPGYCPKILSVG